MKKSLYITQYCHIQNNCIWINGEPIFQEGDSENFSSFIKSAYKNLNQKYAKFHKMDPLCKLGYIGSEYLFQQINLDEIDKRKTAVYLSNSSSSLDTDLKHHNSIADLENYFPSPAIFVYTLPNIVIGEICIKNKIQGENAFYIFENFLAVKQFEQLEMLFNTTNTKSCLGGWVELLDETYESFLYWIDENPNGEAIPLSADHLEYLYTTKKLL